MHRARWSPSRPPDIGGHRRFGRDRLLGVGNHDLGSGVGSAIYMRRWLREAVAYRKRQAPDLVGRRTYLFQSGPAVRGPPTRLWSYPGWYAESPRRSVRAARYLPPAGWTRPQRPDPSAGGSRGGAWRATFETGRQLGLGRFDRRRSESPRAGVALLMRSQPGQDSSLLAVLARGVVSRTEVLPGEGFGPSLPVAVRGTLSR